MVSLSVFICDNCRRVFARSKASYRISEFLCEKDWITQSFLRHKEIKYKDNTTKTKLKYEWHYILRKSKYNNLNYDSAIQCEDIRRVSKARIGKYICSIHTTDLNEIKKRLKKALQI